MANRGVHLTDQKGGRHSRQRANGKRPPRGLPNGGLHKVRRSARHELTSQVEKIEDPGQRDIQTSASNNNLSVLTPLRNQKRRREPQQREDHIAPGRPPKRLRSLPRDPHSEQTLGPEVCTISESQKSHISHWAQENQWPKDFFQEDEMSYLFARKKSTSSPRRKRSESSLTASTTPSDQKSREDKSAPYKDPSYETLLETQGGFYMSDHELGISDASKMLCRRLLEKQHTHPKNTIFSDKAFEKACRKLRGKNEARIIQDIARLLVPSAETLATLGDEHFNSLVESVNEGWNNSIPVTNPRPQPDYAAGFSRSAFSDDHFGKLQPALGDPLYRSYFMATFYMSFPFLTCEVKCGTTGLDIADRQNAHSMALAIRGIVALFKLAKREIELHRQILTFSISHDHRTVRLYGYYPIVNSPKITIHRHFIHSFDILVEKERWTAYDFTVQAYIESLTLLKNIRSVINCLPPNFSLEPFQPSESQFSDPSKSSTPVENLTLAQDTEKPEHHSNSVVGLQPITPDTSTQAASKKKKRG